MTTRSDSRQVIVTAALLGLAAFAYALLLSEWLQVTPSGVLWNRNNVLFDADTQAVGRVLLGEEKPQFPRRHPLSELWPPVFSGVRSVLGLGLSGPWASVLAVRTVMAGLMAAGYALLVAAALWRGASLLNVIAVVALALGATSMTLVVAPEFYGLSHGLLAIAAGIAVLPLRPMTRVVTLVILAVVAGGTTVTNVLFPLGLAAAVVLGNLTLPPALVRRLPRIVALGVAVGIVGAAALALGPLRGPLQRTRAGEGVGKSTHYRLLTNPVEAGRLAVNGLVFPVVGPEPALAEARRVQLTYNTRSVLDLSALQLPAAAAWLALLGLATWRAFEVRQDRLVVLVLLGWVAGNLFVHNLWGFEMMLYSPHYSPAFVALLALASARLRPATLLPIAAVILAGQAQTLSQIFRAMPSS